MTKPLSKAELASRKAARKKDSKKVEPESKKKTPAPTLVSKTNFKPTAASGARLKPTGSKLTKKEITNMNEAENEIENEEKIEDTTSEENTEKETALAGKTSYLPADEIGKKKERKPKAPRDPNAPRLTGKSKEFLPKIITVLVDKNPRRAGSETFAIFEHYKTGETVEQFIAKGGRLIDVKADVARKHISLADPKE